LCDSEIYLAGRVRVRASGSTAASPPAWLLRHEKLPRGYKKKAANLNGRISSW